MYVLPWFPVGAEVDKMESDFLCLTDSVPKVELSLLSSTALPTLPTLPTADWLPLIFWIKFCLAGFFGGITTDLLGLGINKGGKFKLFKFWQLFEFLCETAAVWFRSFVIVGGEGVSVRFWKAKILSRTELFGQFGWIIGCSKQDLVCSPLAESNEPRGEALEEFVVAPSEP